MTSRSLTFSACPTTSIWDQVQLSEARRASLDIGCAVLTAQWDWTDPSLGSVELALSRVRTTDQHDRIGTIVVNPGGPGASGVDYLPFFVASLPAEILTRFDVVAFDPRGTGDSAPVRCPPLPEPIRTAPVTTVVTDAGFAAGLQRTEMQARACIEALGERAGLFGTDQTAHDLDLLRKVVGDDRLTYVGFSYGARLGAHYAHLFPDRVRALVLDAPPAPQAASARVVDAQLAAFEHLFDTYATQCPTRPTCSASGDIGAVYERVVARARRTPILSGRPAGDPPATWDVVVRAVLALVGTSADWPVLDAALREADDGDAGTVYDVIDNQEGKNPAHPSADSSQAQFVIHCDDAAPAPASAGAARIQTTNLRQEAIRLAGRHHRFGAYAGWWLFECYGWTPQHHALPEPTTTTSAPILVIAGTGDASTPLVGARELAKALGPQAHLLTRTGSGHTSFTGSTCIDQNVVRYLLTGDPPASGATCD